MQNNIPHPLHPPAPPLGPAPAPVAGAGAGHGGHQACAACKHQRKKCTGNCEMASYFPANRSREFGLVHRVFGVSNVTKMLKAVDSIPERERAAETLTWEAEWRIVDPSEGCYNEVIQLKYENAMLRDVIRSCGRCSHLALPPPYHSPVPQPERHRANGNNPNNGGGNFIHNHEDIIINNNNNGNIGGGVGVAAMVHQQMINYPVYNGDLINGYHHPHPLMYMPEMDERDIARGALYLPNHIR
ncbi:LOB domain-containing protein 2-like [Phoenix dactylifera]|uniref:LOB domain-containing protein 2-like n=1 Tax=Phoenix dactylifera TaxID=42345 RepID=A0A8B7MV70_PHODC|nr:LOB domain-containing protein 2-like [Phoenix dactylifera]